MREMRKTIVVAVLAAAFLDFETRLPVGHIVAWLAGLSHPGLMPS